MLKSAIVLSLFAAGLSLGACSTMGTTDQGMTKRDQAPMPQSNPMPASPPAMPSGGSGY